MKKRILSAFICGVMAVTFMAGCGQSNASSKSTSETSSSSAETVKWPTKAITIICPWAVGGLADQINRAMSEYGEEQFGKPLLADNILGSGGAIALTQYLQEKPNSNKMIFGGEGSFAIAPLTSKVEYKLDDFEPVINVYSSTFVLLSNPKTNIDSFDKFKEYVKSNEVKFGANGVNSSEALQGAGLIKEMGGNFQIVSYDGANEALQALVSGEIDFAITHSSLAKEFVKAGSVNPVVAFNKEKLVDEVYNLDCVEDHGYDTWMTNVCAVFMRKGTDKAVIDKAYNGLLNILKNKSFLETAANMGVKIDPMTGDEVKAYIESCTSKAEKYSKYVSEK